VIEVITLAYHIISPAYLLRIANNQVSSEVKVCVHAELL